MNNILRVAEGLFINTILIILLVSSGLFAAEETLPTPEEIIEKNIEAMGGKEARKKIKNIKRFSIRRWIQMNREFTATEYKERPEKHYNSDETPEGIVRFGSNGKIAWMIYPGEGAYLFKGAELSNYLLATKFDPNDVPYKSMKTEGIEKINGKDCYKVVKTRENGPKRVVYYDKKSYLIVEFTDYYKPPQPGNILKNGIHTEEYKEINGILFPYKEFHVQNGQRVEEITYEKIEVNIEMPEGIFDIPEEVKAIMNRNETEQHAQQ